MSEIHPTAIVESGADLGQNVKIGAYAYIGSKVKLGDGCIVHHHASIEGLSKLGENNEIYPYAFVGGKTHDLKYEGGDPGLVIGDNNVFREYTTVHLATADGDVTKMGNNNLILAYSHVAHDCVINDHLVMSSHAALGGHVIVSDWVNIGWGVGVHQFCRLGDYAMAGACAKIVQDVPPYMIADGNPAEVRTINKVGLERRGFTLEDIELVRLVFKTLYREGLNRSQAMQKLIKHEHVTSPVLQRLFSFIDNSERGLA